jgi:hypothetical protein
MTTPSNTWVLSRLFWKLFFRGRTASRKPGREGKVSRHTMAGTLLLYGLVGLFPCASVNLVDAFTFSALLHGMTLFMVVFHMISTAGSVLFNKEEAEILLHRPVSPGELLRAKAFVLCAVAGMLAGALNFPGMIASVAVRDARWWFPLAHAGSLVLLVVFSAGTLVMVYQACLRWFGRERLDNIMTTMQTVLTVLLVLGSQSFRLIQELDVEELRHSWWLMAMPPTWFAAFDALLASREPETWMILPAACGLVSTGLVGWLGFHRLAASYGEGMMLLNEPGPQAGLKRGRGRWLRALVSRPPLSWWISCPVQRQAFILTAAYLFRDRETKLRLYPGLAQMLAMPLVFIFMGRTTGGPGIDLAMAGIYLGWLPLMGLQMLACSEHWRAAELFQLAPGGRWQPLFHGSRKAVLLLLVVPMLTVLSCMVVIFHGWSQSLLLLVPNVLLLPVWSLVPGLTEAWTPLAKPYDAKSQTQRGCLTMLLVMGVSGIVGAAGWLAMNFQLLPAFIAGQAVVVLLIYALMYRRVGRSRAEMLIG